MTRSNIVTGVLLDEVALTLEEFARACEMAPQWVVAHVEAELIGVNPHDSATWRFSSADLIRARRLAAAERMFDANQDAAALMVDLIEEVERLRKLLQRAGFT
ncbi:chaperone modulator CbpM [Paraherbaspirillum soli]|uniref:Chaperone modulator CbpM n=1 Tax=Paraherbaspirillum soli TaxID=631222 RepID=A0ABW0M8Z1_9BURK